MRLLCCFFLGVFSRGPRDSSRIVGNQELAPTDSSSLSSDILELTQENTIRAVRVGALQNLIAGHNDQRDESAIRIGGPDCIGSRVGRNAGITRSVIL